MKKITAAQIFIIVLSGCINKAERLKYQSIEECKKTTSAVFDLVGSDNNSEMKVRAENYCDCLYNQVSQKDWEDVANSKKLLPDLLNLKYKEQQETCYQEHFKDIEFEEEKLFETNNEKITFWTGRIASYYMMAYKEFNSKYLIKMVECLSSYIEEWYVNDLVKWEKEELTATEIFDKHKEIFNKAENCYNNIK